MSDERAGARLDPHAGSLPQSSDAALACVVRDESARIVVALARSFGSLDVAEEATASAIEEALRQWRRDGVPPQPGAWLMTAARRNALDIVRRSRKYRDVLARAAPTGPGGQPAPGEGLYGIEASPGSSEDDEADYPAPSIGSGADDEVDERVALLFGCCHPALSTAAQLSLTLRAVLGLTTHQIARATVEPSATVGQRIARAKRKIGSAGIPLRVPRGGARAARLDTVLAVIAVMYDSAHLRPGDTAEADRDLAGDALWLASVVARSLPEEAEAHGLRALLLFHGSREPARSAAGELVRLPEQDRSLWDRTKITAGHVSLERAAELRNPGRWQLHAAIGACHSDAVSSDRTDWPQVLTLYDMLLRFDASPLVRLNRAVALAEVRGPEAALAEIARLGDRLDSYYLLHAVRAELLARAGYAGEAEAAAVRAAGLTDNLPERRLLLGA